MRTIEQNTYIPYSGRITSARGRIEMFTLKEFFGPLERFGLRNILVGTKLEYQENFGDDYLRAVQDGYSPILVGNHMSHVDGVLLGKVSRELTWAANDVLPQEKQMEGLALIMAASLNYGQQGPMLKSFLDASYPILEDHDIIPFYNVRPQDLRRYGMIPDYIQERIDLIKAISEGWGVALLPEGQTKGGKTNSKTKASYGMIPFMTGAIPAIMNATIDAEKRPLIIPVSVIGGSEIQSANTKLPSLSAFVTGLGAGDMHIADLFVGSPIRADEGEIGELFRAKNYRGLNEIVGRTIASALPEKKRGVYA